MLGEAAPVGVGTLTAPITQRECVYWKYEVIQRTRQGDKTFTRRIGAGESKEYFMLRDATGHILIDPHIVQIRQIKKSASRTLLPGGVQLQGLRTNKHIGFALSRMYANEWQIPLRSTIYAIGTLVNHEDGSTYLVPGNGMAAVTMLPFDAFIRKQRLWGFAMVAGAIASMVGGLYLLVQGL